MATHLIRKPTNPFMADIQTMCGIPKVKLIEPDTCFVEEITCDDCQVIASNILGRTGKIVEECPGCGQGFPDLLLIQLKIEE